MGSSSNIGLPKNYRGKVEQEQHRLGLDSKSATVRHIIDSYFAHQQTTPPPPPATPAQETPNEREVPRYHVIA